MSVVELGKRRYEATGTLAWIVSPWQSAFALTALFARSPESCFADGARIEQKGTGRWHKRREARMCGYGAAAGIETSTGSCISGGSRMVKVSRGLGQRTLPTVGCKSRVKFCSTFVLLGMARFFALPGRRSKMNGIV